jgi:hypothetical protein
MKGYTGSNLGHRSQNGQLQVAHDERQWRGRWLAGAGSPQRSVAPNAMGPSPNQKEQRDDPHLRFNSVREAATRAHNSTAASPDLGGSGGLLW